MSCRLDQSFMRKTQQSLAHGGAGQLVLLHQSEFVDVGTGRQIKPQDPLPKLRIDRVAARSLRPTATAALLGGQRRSTWAPFDFPAHELKFGRSSGEADRRRNFPEVAGAMRNCDCARMAFCYDVTVSIPGARRLQKRNVISRFSSFYSKQWDGHCTFRATRSREVAQYGCRYDLQRKQDTHKHRRDH